jgi:hypothetical protein
MQVEMAGWRLPIPSWRAQTASPRPLNAYVRLDPPVYLGVARLA